MAEYISREDIIEELEEEIQTEWHLENVWINKGLKIALKDIKSQPAADVQPAPQWISVEERLPDDCVEVLVHDTDCGVVIGWYDKKDSYFTGEFINQLDAVTHWMPLPEPPKE